jgi:hypothetical protein
MCTPFSISSKQIFIISNRTPTSIASTKDYSLKYGNYSKLNLLKTTKLKSKYAKAIFEMLEANKYKKTFTIKEIDLKKYLKYDVKNYKFSYLTREITRAYEQVKCLIDFNYIAHKTDKPPYHTHQN